MSGAQLQIRKKEAPVLELLGSPGRPQVGDRGAPKEPKTRQMALHGRGWGTNYRVTL